MAVTLPNTGIVVPDAGNRDWYAMFVNLMTALDTAVAADDYIVPASAQHIEASMAALFDDLYSLAYALAANATSGYGFGGYGSNPYGA
jgi:hypothetical protein